MSSLSILIIGDVERSEFQEPLGIIRELYEVRFAPHVAAAKVVILEDGFAPDVLVFAQAFPGQFTPGAVEKLLRLTPLARVVALLGAWCEGEGRSGRPWPATARLYWHQWPCRTERQLPQLARGKKCAWTLPITATEEDRLSAELETDEELTFFDSPATPFTDPRGLGTAVIRAASREAWEWLGSACRELGFSSVWWRDSSPPIITGAQVAVFDGAAPSKEEFDCLQGFISKLQPVPVIALWSFLRIEDLRRLRTAGVAAVLSKPFLIADLAWLLAKHCAPVATLRSPVP